MKCLCFFIETVQISTYSSHPQKLAPQDPQEDCHDEYIYKSLIKSRVPMIVLDIPEND